MQALCRTVVMNEELSHKAKLLFHQSDQVPTLKFGQELWVETERTRSRMKAAKMRFLLRMAGLSLTNRVKSSNIQRELLLLGVERSQLRWLRHLIGMPRGHLPLG